MLRYGTLLVRTHIHNFGIPGSIAWIYMGSAMKPVVISRNAAVSDCTRMHSLMAGLLLVVIVFGLSFTGKTHASVSRSSQATNAPIQRDLESTGLFPEMFQAGLQAYQEKDYKEALRLWLPMAQGGHALAQYNVGISFAQGLGVEKNLAAASKWWSRSALQDNMDAQYNLGLVHARGLDGIEQNLSLAAHWWRQAALNGDAMSQFNLGMLYAQGKGVPQSLETAIKWWRLAANQNLPRAIKLLNQLASEKSVQLVTPDKQSHK